MVPSDCGLLGGAWPSSRSNGSRGRAAGRNHIRVTSRAAGVKAPGEQVNMTMITSDLRPLLLAETKGSLGPSKCVCVCMCVGVLGCVCVVAQIESGL